MSQHVLPELVSVIPHPHPCPRLLEALDKCTKCGDFNFRGCYTVVANKFDQLAYRSERYNIIPTKMRMQHMALSTGNWTGRLTAIVTFEPRATT